MSKLRLLMEGDGDQVKVGGHYGGLIFSFQLFCALLSQVWLMRHASRKIAPLSLTASAGREFVRTIPRYCSAAFL